MTQKDAMDGGTDPLSVDHNLFDARENSPSSMRVVAQELRGSLDGLLGKGGQPNGDIAQISGCGLSGNQIGMWDDALALATTVGSSNAGVKFAEVYQNFVDAYQKVVEAVEASADSHDRARRENEGNA
ncbi:hypothetical protein [Nonomuraea basaltis]|uniref:hypothetical protein n=1 Tax=Nonomuraea basaltis TaxID=2495887 RepID=UPI00110C4AD3|nr:hypothetical protein [Nonomuraea basaltis]TMR96079.1 hypothetical protein EJK15_25020 [Nonomuraea basaltis]